MTVLRQIAAHLDGRSGLHAQAVTDDVNWPSVLVTPARSGSGSQLWQCTQERWISQLLEGQNRQSRRVAIILTTIREDLSASEVADGIKEIYRTPQSEPESG